MTDTVTTAVRKDMLVCGALSNQACVKVSPSKGPFVNGSKLVADMINFSADDPDFGCMSTTPKPD